VNLLPGESIETSNPGRPNAQFDAFTSSCMRQIGMAIGIPYEVLVMHYQSSYSAARGALLMAWRFFMGWRDWLATNMCQPVYELWLADEIANGDIAAPGFFADDVVRHAWCSAQWVGDGPGSIDPGKEVAAAKERVALGISTLQAESIAYDGVDWETKHRQAIKEAEARKEAGMPAPGQEAAASAPAASTPADPSQDPPGPQDAQDPSVAEQAAAEQTRAFTAWLQREPVQPKVEVHVEAPIVNVEMPDRQPAAAAPRATAREVVRDKVTGLITSVIDRELND
jgi:capsid protein